MSMTVLEATTEIVKSALTDSTQSISNITADTSRPEFLKGIEELYKLLDGLMSGGIN